MGKLLLVLCLVASGVAVGGAKPSPPPVPQAPPPPQPTPFGRTMSTVITVSISVFFFLLFLCAYINQCRLRDPGAYGAAAGAGAAAGGPSKRGKRGLDPAVVATFPIVRYKEIVEHKIGKGVLECAVCLTSFEDSDDLRLLPHCSHAFHPDCIDPWLLARVTCPLCRANLEKPPPPQPEAVAPASPEQEEEEQQRQPSPPPPPREAVAIPVVDGTDESEEDEEEAMELQMLRSARRAARMPWSHSTGHSLYAASAAAAEEGDHERFTLRLPAHVTEEILRSRRLRHATSLINLSDLSSEGGSRGGWLAGAGGFGNGGGGGSSSHGGRRWHAFLATTVSWARGGGDGSVRKGWDGSTRRGRDAGESSRKGAASPTAAGRP